MFIECFKDNGTDYLRIIDGYSYTENGVKKHKRRVIRNIGPLSRYTDGQPDYLSRLRQSFKEGNPLIESLADLVESKNVRPAITLTFDPQEEKDYYCCPKNIGYFFLDGRQRPSHRVSAVPRQPHRSDDAATGHGENH